MHRKIRWTTRWILGLLLLWLVTGVQAMPEGDAGAVPEPTLEELGPVVSLAESRGGLLYRTGTAGSYIEAPVLKTEVHLRVTGLIVRGQVRQRFSNPTSQWLEGVYVFPLPETAGVDRLRMIVGERIIEGQIKEKQQAKKIYQQAKRAGKKASLVEQERPNIFTNSVANIGPGEEVTVEIEYQHTARFDSGKFSLRFPMVVGPRFIPGLPAASAAAGQPRASAVAGLPAPAGAGGTSAAAASAVQASFGGSGWAFDTDQVPDASRITPPVLHPSSGVRNWLDLEVELAPGFELEVLDSPYHPIDVEPGADDGSYSVKLAEGPVPANRDFELVWAPPPGRAPRAALFSEVFEGEAYALLMVVPPQEPATQQRARLPRETVLVIDTSGSMHGASIVQARAALHFALDSLAPEDTFNIIRFSSDMSTLFATSQPAQAPIVERARQWVNGLQAGGGTVMLPAIQAALVDGGDEERVRQVVFMTDGAVGNEQALFELIERRIGRSRFFTVGIGSAPNAHFMRRAAAFGRGTFTYIGDPQEVRTKMGELFHKLESPQLTGIDVAWSDTGAEVWPPRIPDLYAGEPVVVTARLADLAGEAAITGSRGEAPWERRFQLSGGAPGGIHRLWARRKIASLMDRMTAGESAETVRSQVLEVALHHHLVSRYTSLVAVDVTPSRPTGDPLSTRPVPTELPHGWSPNHVGGVLPSGATPAPLLLTLSVLLLLAGAGLLWAGRRG